MAPEVENWDDDADFHGDLFAASIQSTAPPSLSSRISTRSESIAADDEWQMLISPTDDNSRFNAIASAKSVGIPLPANIPPSALIGGSIKKLGKQKSKPQNNDDDWGEDLEIPQTFEAKLKLKSDTVMSDAPSPLTPSNPADEFDADWAEGSLGIRFGGTRRDQRQRSSSASAMSPSLGSCITFESEDDEIGGLLLPDEPIDFTDRLKRKKDADKDSPISVSTIDFTGQVRPVEQPTLKKQRTEDEDMSFGLDFGNADLTDKRKRRIHPAIKISSSKVMPSPSRAAPVTSITFTTEKPAVSRIPRPTHPSGQAQPLDPVYESMAQHITPRAVRPPPTTTGAQLLRSKRSAPALSSRQKADLGTPRPPVPLLPSGLSRVTNSRLASHGRHFSEQDRQSVADLRSASRMSQERGTPSRSGFRKDVAPPALARQALSKRTVTKPKGMREYTGDELAHFDDLPTSAAKEQKYMKEPTVPDLRNPKVRSLRHKPSFNRKDDISLRERMMTPQPYQSNPSSIASSSTVPSTPLAPPTPKSNSYFPMKTDNTPRFARDTAASRMHREQRLGGTGNIRPQPPPIAPVINWKAQVAARSPHNSPTANRKKKGEGKQPVLIKQMSLASIKSEKGMTYIPSLHRWEGNEHALNAFNNPSTTSLPLNKENVYSHRHSNSGSTIFDGRSAGLAPARTNNASPPRPALISQISAAGVRIEGGMVFDPQRMKWLKLDPRMKLDPNGAMSPSSVSIEEEEDPFAGLEDLKDERTSMMSPASFALPGAEGRDSIGGVTDEMSLGEEFDIGPGFIKRQRHEEIEWARRVELWMTGSAQHHINEGWKWAIRDVAREYEGGTPTTFR